MLMEQENDELNQLCMKDTNGHHFSTQRVEGQGTMPSNASRSTSRSDMYVNMGGL